LLRSLNQKPDLIRINEINKYIEIIEFTITNSSHLESRKNHKFDKYEKIIQVFTKYIYNTNYYVYIYIMDLKCLRIYKKKQK